MARWWTGAGASTSSRCGSGWRKAHQFAARELLDLGFELFCEPKAGMLLWARHPAVPNAGEFAYKAAEHDIMLGPGHLFSVDLAPGPWMRFNVAFCTDGAVFAFLRSQGLGARAAAQKACPGSRRLSVPPPRARPCCPRRRPPAARPGVQRDTDRAAIGAALVVQEAAQEFDRRAEGRPFANGTNTTL